MLLSSAQRSDRLLVRGAPGTPPAHRADVQRLIQLQSLIGNARVTDLVASQPSPRFRSTGGRLDPHAVQRCECSVCAGKGLTRQAVMRETDGPTAEAAAPLEGKISDPSSIVGALSQGGAPAGSEQRMCFPPSAFEDPQFGSGFGMLAERYIEHDYCDTMGCAPGTVYIDNYNPLAYRQFLIAHNPGLSSGAKGAALTAASVTGIARPDILSDDGARRDYYEIKPLSPSGAVAGTEKIAEIAAFMTLLGLPYVPGVTYTPSKDIPIMSGMVLGEPLAVSLNVQRYVPGIVTYSLCLEGNLAQILAKVAMAALLAWIVAQLLPVVVAGGALVLA